MLVVVLSDLAWASDRMNRKEDDEFGLPPTGECEDDHWLTEATRYVDIKCRVDIVNSIEALWLVVSILLAYDIRRSGQNTCWVSSFLSFPLVILMIELIKTDRRLGCKEKSHKKERHCIELYCAALYCTAARLLPSYWSCPKARTTTSSYAT
jgi:hypothetical protein